MAFLNKGLSSKDILEFWKRSEFFSSYKMEIYNDPISLIC